jgi:hypothetical protein
MKEYRDRDGEYHREGGPALEWDNGGKLWYWHGQYHRQDGPACEYAYGTKIWCWHGKYHREDGPAYEDANGFKVWFWHGQQIHCQSNEEFLRIVKLKAFW